MLLSLLLLLTAAAPPSDSAAAYRVYTASGEAATLEAIVAAMDTVNVVFIGEAHDDSVAHAIERMLLEQAYARYAAPDSSDSTAGDGTAGRPLVLSLEMFDRDVQSVVDEYLSGLITEEHFLQSSRPWTTYASDYRPLVEFAGAHSLPVIAANAPRRYVNRAMRLGPDALGALSDRAKATLPPLPYPGPSAAYRAEWDSLMASMMEGHPRTSAPAADSLTSGLAPLDSAVIEPVLPDTMPDVAPDTVAASSHGHGSMGFMLEAQALWDAGMAYSIAEQLMRTPRSLILHVTGGFHIERGTGTPEALQHYRPGTPTLTVAIRPGEDAAFDADRHGHLGDFVILTDPG